MIIDLSRLESAPIKFDLSLEPSEIDLESDFAKTKHDGQFKGSLTSQNHWIMIEGEIQAKVEIACGRCLDPVKQDCDISFETAFVKAEKLTDEVEDELDIKGLDVSIFEGDKIDLIEVAQEQIVLSMPAQLYCKEDCKGLCQKCGANRNLIDCKCDDADVDSRWGALKNLKNNQ